MSLIGSVGGVYGSGTALNRITTPGLAEGIKAPAPINLAGTGATEKTQESGFGNVFEKMILSVNTQQQQAQSMAKDVLLGNSDNLHGSMIAMQEAGVAFQMMVEVRNKVVESYQELMRMPV
jgi:flagellar hook-basal body complex protein FliE